MKRSLIDKNDDDMNNGTIWSKDDGLNNENDLKETGEDICDEVLLVIIRSKWFEVEIEKLQLTEDHKWKTFEKKNVVSLAIEKTEVIEKNEK